MRSVIWQWKPSWGSAHQPAWLTSCTGSCFEGKQLLVHEPWPCQHRSERAEQKMTSELCVWAWQWWTWSPPLNDTQRKIRTNGLYKQNKRCIIGKQTPQSSAFQFHELLTSTWSERDMPFCVTGDKCHKVMFLRTLVAFVVKCPQTVLISCWKGTYNYSISNGV